MSRSVLVCLHCREPLAYVKASDRVRILPATGRRWEDRTVVLLRCPVCRNERRVTIGSAREAA